MNTQGVGTKSLGALPIILAAAVFQLSCSSESQSTRVRSYSEVRQEVDSLTSAACYAEAIAVLESVLPDSGDGLYETTRDLAQLYHQTGEYEKALAIWRHGHRRGFFYLIDPRFERFAPYSGLEGFALVVETDKRYRARALETSTTVYDVAVPNAYTFAESYPLMIVLHGGGSTKERARQHWQSALLSERFVTAYVQSYLHYGTAEFGWAGRDPRARRDIRRCFDEIVQRYSVDTTRVIVGGISAGGMTAIDVSINGVIPNASFIGVCPGKPTEFGEADVAAAKHSGARGWIIGGESDFYRGEQEEMVAVFDSQGFKHEFIVVPGLGHDYPDDFTAHLDAALEYLGGW